jgi:hypothetical protein
MPSGISAEVLNIVNLLLFYLLLVGVNPVSVVISSNYGNGKN